jgi:predicted lysophospholipase L1 biosynthesis ABC-type transport system permease subunit
VIRARVTVLLDEFQRLDFDLLAVDPSAFPAVAAYPHGVSSFSVAQVMSVLGPDPVDVNPNVLPVVISSSSYTRHLDIGDPLEIEIGEQTLPVEVAGIVLEFPLVDDIFVVTDLARFTDAVDLEMLGLMDNGVRETWLAVDPGAHANVLEGVADTGLADAVVGDAGILLDSYRNNLVFREVNAAFELNAMVLVPLSGMGFLLIQLFTVRRRAGEFKVLQAIGLSRTQFRSLLFFEGVMFIALGLLIGFGVGYGLVVLTQPFLAQILPPLGGGFVLSRLGINWLGFGIRYAALVIFYGIGLAVLAAVAVRRQPDVQI